MFRVQTKAPGSNVWVDAATGGTRTDAVRIASSLSDGVVAVRVVAPSGKVVWSS